MHHRISQNLTAVTLKNRQKFSLNRLPAFLVHLGSLRELVIDRNHKGLFYPLNSIIQGLPACLQRLELRFKNSQKLIESTASVATLHPSDLASGNANVVSPSQWTLKSAFPKLETLYFTSDADRPFDEFSALPETLTSLSLPFPDKSDRISAFSSMIPRQLLHLELQGANNLTLEFLDHLPPHLTSLAGFLPSERLNGRSERQAQLLSRLPRLLTQFSPPLENFYSSSLQSLPPSITTLAVHDPLLDVALNAQFPFLREVLFRSVTSYTVKMLPHTVHTMQIALINFSDESPIVWPPHLTTLWTPSVAGHIKALPTTLRTLVLQVSFKPIVDFAVILPTLTNLTSLKCPSSSNIIDFPPRLTSLEFIGGDPWLELNPSAGFHSYRSYNLNGKVVAKGFPLEKLPPCITSFQAEIRLYASQLKHFPLAIRNLKLQEIFEDADFNPLNSVEISRTLENFALGRKLGLRERFDWNGEKTSITALLPRNLGTLECTDCQSLVEVADWKLLPPALTSICLGSLVGLSASNFRLLPIERLSSLRLSVAGLEDDDIKMLPRNITGYLSLEDFRLTTKAALFTPLDMELFLVDPNSEKEFQNVTNKMVDFRDALEARCAENDPTYLIKALSMQENLLEELGV